jgi:4,5-dihydroxyphthalate decarboxylase
VQTAGVWVRGMLAESYGLSPTSVEWYVMSMQHWEDAEGDQLRPRDGSVVRTYQTASAQPGLDICCEALLNGEVDLIGMTEPRIEMLLSNYPVQRLFHRHQEEEHAYFGRTRVFPIMHVLTMKTSVAEATPELPALLFGLFCEAKRWSQGAIRPVPSWSFAWKDEYLDGEREFFDSDPWAFGLKTNQSTLQTFLEYCYQQGIAARRMTPAELFAPSTHDLTDLDVALA